MAVGFVKMDIEMLEKIGLSDGIEGMYVKKSYNDLFKKNYEDLIPVKVIFNRPRTICYWEDGSKTIVVCGKDDVFSEEVGILQCIARKAFGGNRSALLNLVKNAYRQPPKNEE